MPNGRIKVLQLGSPTGLYGAERWILALVKYFDRSRIRPIVASIRDSVCTDSPLTAEARKLGIPSESFEAFGKVNLTAVRELRRFIVSNRVQILHTHGYKTDIIGLLAIQGTACRIVSTPHGWTKKSNLKLRLYEIADRLVFPLFDAVVPLSQNLYDQLGRIPHLKKKLYLIKNGVDIGEITSVTKTADEISKWREQGSFVIGFVGRLTEGKGVDVLLKAIARLGSPTLRAAIVGEGECRPALENLTRTLGIEKRVKFFGFREDRISFLRGFDVFVLPSRSEGIPRSVMEAMAAETSVVVSDCEGCKALVSNSETGIVFKVDDEKQLSNCIQQLKDNEQLKAMLIKNAKQAVHETFSAERMAQEYEKLYREIITGFSQKTVRGEVTSALQPR
jgi:glycosyltransferase involved in cell wall biosynthesis